MSEKATFRKTRLPAAQATNEFNDFVFSLNSTSLTRFKPNAKPCYPCEFCGLQFSCKTTLSQHILTHEIDSLCKSEKEHIKSVESPFARQECNLSFSEESNFQKRCLITYSKRNFVCVICKESFPSTNYLERHCLLKHAQETTSYIEENKLTDDNINAQSLESLLSKEPFLCNENSVKNSGIHKNSVTHTNQNRFVCNVCNKKFILKRNYTAHCNTHDNIKVPKNKLLVYEVCQQKFSTKRNPANHLTHIDACVSDSNAKGGGGVFKSASKDAYLKGTKNLKDYTKYKDTSQGKIFRDTAEGEDFKESRLEDLEKKSEAKEFKDKTSLKKKTRCKDKRKRRKRKALSEEFTCDVCNKSYKLKIAFLSHQMSHVSVKPTCEVCHKKFPSNKQLKLHFRRHSDVRFFFCELCNKGFKHKHHLRAHFITHTDELPFVCEVCNKGYKHKWGLKQHELLHAAKELPFVCEICGKAFEQGCDLDVHFSVHAREADDCDGGIKMLAAKDEPKQDIAIGSF